MTKLKYALLMSSIMVMTAMAFSPCIVLVTTSNVSNIHIMRGTSTNWAGYAVETNLVTPQNNAVTDVKGSWIVPTVTGTATAYSASWIGIDGYSSNSVEQIGTDSDISSGKATYYAWYEMYPKACMNLKSNVLAIAPGNTISAEVKFMGKGNFQLSITDVTTGKSFTTTQKSGTAKMSSAEWIMEAPWSGGVLPLANFGVNYFSNSQVTINGITGLITDGHWQNDAITMQTSTTPPVIKAQPSSTDGSSFTVTWYHS